MAKLTKPCPVNAADVEFLVGKDYNNNVVDVPISSLPDFPEVDVECALQNSPTIRDLRAEDAKLLQLYLALKGRLDDFRILPIHLQKSIEDLEELNLCNVRLTLCDVEGDTTFHGNVNVDEKLTAHEIETEDLMVNGTATINNEEVAHSHIDEFEADDATIERLTVNESIDDKGTLNVDWITTTHDIENDWDITNTGDFTNGGNIENQNNIINHGNTTNDGNIENGGNITNHGNITNDQNFSNGGNIENQGDITNHGSIENDNNIINHGDIENENNFTNMGNIENDGDILNHGNIANDENFINGGNIENTGNITNHGNIENDGNNVNHGNFTNDGNITNGGDITNEGKLTNKNGIENTGDITNHGNVINDGDITSAGNFTNGGDITNAGNITNEWDITNTGKVTTKDLEAETATVTTKLEVTGATETNGILNHWDITTDDAMINGDLEVDGKTDLQELEVNQEAHFRRSVEVYHDFAVSWDTLLNGDTKINGDFEVNGDEVHSGDVVYNGDVEIKGTLKAEDLDIEMNDYQKRDEKGAANGYASLDNTGKVPNSQLPNITGGINFKGAWNPNNGFPSNPHNGDMYQASVSGTIAGITYNPWDRIIWSEDQAQWQHLIDNTWVQSVNGRSWAVVDVQDTTDRKNTVNLTTPATDKYLSEKAVADLVNPLIQRIEELEESVPTSPDISWSLPQSMTEGTQYNIIMADVRATDDVVPTGSNVNVAIDVYDWYIVITPAADITNPVINVLHIKHRS